MILLYRHLNVQGKKNQNPFLYALKVAKCIMYSVFQQKSSCDVPALLDISCCNCIGLKIYSPNSGYERKRDMYLKEYVSPKEPAYGLDSEERSKKAIENNQHEGPSTQPPPSSLPDPCCSCCSGRAVAG